MTFHNRAFYTSDSAYTPSGSTRIYTVALDTSVGALAIADGETSFFWMEDSSDKTIWAYVIGEIGGSGTTLTVDNADIIESSASGAWPTFAGAMNVRSEITATKLNELRAPMDEGYHVILSWGQSNMVTYDGDPLISALQGGFSPLLYQKIKTYDAAGTYDNVRDKVVRVKGPLFYHQDTGKGAPPISMATNGGMAAGFAQRYIDEGRNNGAKVLIVPMASGGTGFYSGTSGTSPGSWMAPQTSVTLPGSSLWTATRDEINTVLSDGVSKIVAIIGHQGESDTDDASQASGHYAQLRHALLTWKGVANTDTGFTGQSGNGFTATTLQPSFADVPCVVGTLKSDWIASTGTSQTVADKTTVNDGIISLSTDTTIDYAKHADLSAYTVSSISDSTVMTNSGGLVHFNRDDDFNAGYNEFWTAFVAAETDTSTPVAPGNVTNFQVTATGSTTMDFSWDTITGNPVPTADFQMVLAGEGFTAPASGFVVNLTAGSGISGTTHQVTGLTQSTSYDIRVRGYNSSGTSPSWTSLSGQSTTTPVAPSVPTSISATPSAAQVQVTWAAPATGDTPIHYNVKWSEDNATWTDLTGWAAADNNQLLDTGVLSVVLTTGDIPIASPTTLYFQIIPINAVGTGTTGTTGVVNIPAAGVSTLLKFKQSTGITSSGTGTQVTGWANQGTGGSTNDVVPGAGITHNANGSLRANRSSTASILVPPSATSSGAWPMTSGITFGIQYNPSVNITNVTSALPGVVTTDRPHNIPSGSPVNGVMSGITGTMSALNGNEYTCTYVSATTFSIGITTTSWSYTSGGSVDFVDNQMLYARGPNSSSADYFWFDAANNQEKRTNKGFTGNLGGGLQWIFFTLNAAGDCTVWRNTGNSWATDATHKGTYTGATVATPDDYLRFLGWSSTSNNFLGDVYNIVYDDSVLAEADIQTIVGTWASTV